MRIAIKKNVAYIYFPEVNIVLQTNLGTKHRVVAILRKL